MRSGGGSDRFGRRLLIAAALALGLAPLALQAPALAGADGAAAAGPTGAAAAKSATPAAPSKPPAAASAAAGGAIGGSAGASTNSGSEEIPSSTTVIPQMGQATAPVAAAAGAAGNPAPGSDSAETEIDQYRDAQDLDSVRPPRLHSLHEFLAETSDLSPIGVEIREDHCKLANGKRAEGLAIVRVRGGSPAAKAGLRAYRGTGRNVLEGFSVLAALVFPPAILATAMLDSTHVGESYDLIIGVDGERVSNMLEFEDQMRNVKPGDTVYLGLIRDGNRIQVPVHVPVDTAWTY